MQTGYARTSLLLLGVSVVLLIALTIFESAFMGTSPAAERIITFLALVVPAAVGAVFGVLSLVRQERRRWLAITGMILNTLFALFHLLIVLYAG